MNVPEKVFSPLKPWLTPWLCKACHERIARVRERERQRQSLKKMKGERDGWSRGWRLTEQADSVLACRFFPV